MTQQDKKILATMLMFIMRGILAIIMNDTMKEKDTLEAEFMNFYQKDLQDWLK